MITSDRMRHQIENWEGLRLEAYRDPVNIWTIGYGHTGDEVHEGLSITAEQADALLVADLHKFENSVRKLAGTTTQGQFDALVSFCFNLGSGALASSTLLKKHRAGDFAGAADEFLKWDHAGGRELPGLTKRRRAERLHYLGQIP